MNIYDDSQEVSYVREDCEGKDKYLWIPLLCLRKKGGPTKMKTIALNGDNRIEIKFNDKGQPIDEEFVKLSSFLGPLGREIVPFTIPDWRKLPSDMREKLWKCVQARYKLDQEWQKHYVLKEMGALWRTSKSRLGKSEEMKNRRKKQTSYTGGRRGYARMTEDIKKKTGKQVVSRVEVWIEAHKKKNGEPINTKTTEAIIVKTIPHKTKCKLLDWSGSTEVVAEGRFSLDDPKALVHHVPIGPNAIRVWIDIAKVPNVFLWRFASEMVFVEDAVGSTIAWPSDKVVLPFRKQF
ncbi:hypothetical protein Patl1_12080 [Pistacia atlantica]|uniref:Uncharacterized protein n=1 Tax=Pistacia atlantica TaxID=434234 RepID=A0ACC1A5B8_9ROSI|nr:hypothetical protein Patl1_12080 [Pistacia atlantica]